MRTTFIFLPLTLLLSACSPHPGAGGWQAIDKEAIFQRLEIRYAGNADLYTQNQDTVAAWRCFWGAVDKTIASLKCVDAGNADNEKNYSFSVDKQSKEGVLKLGEQVMGRYSWQPPTDPPEE